MWIMPAEKYTFKENDLVWAKMKGYPHWPAKVVKPPKKLKSPTNKIFIFFYGTHEHAWMAPADIVPYMEFRDKYKKPSCRKGFLEAVWEIEEDPLLAISSSVVTPKKKRKKIKKEVDESHPKTSESQSVAPVSLPPPTVPSVVQDSQTLTTAETTRTPANKTQHTEDESNLTDSQPFSIPSSLEGSQEEPLSTKKRRKRPTRSQTTTPASTSVPGERRLTRLAKRLKSEEKEVIDESATNFGEGTTSTTTGDELFGGVKPQTFGDSETVKLDRVESSVHIDKELPSLSQGNVCSGSVEQTDNDDVPTLLDYTSEESSVLHSRVKTEPKVVAHTPKSPEPDPPTLGAKEDSQQLQQQEVQCTESSSEITSPTKRYSTRTRCNPSGGSIVEKLTQSYSSRKSITPLSSPVKQETTFQQHFEQVAHQAKSPEKKTNKQSSSKSTSTQSSKRATRMKASAKGQSGKLKMSSVSSPSKQRMTRSRVKKELIATTGDDEGDGDGDDDGSAEVNQQQASLESVNEVTESEVEVEKKESDVQRPMDVEKKDTEVEASKEDINVRPLELAKTESEDCSLEMIEKDTEDEVTTKEELPTNESSSKEQHPPLLVVMEASISQTHDHEETMEITKEPVEKGAEKVSSDSTTTIATVSNHERAPTERPVIIATSSHSSNEEPDNVEQDNDKHLDVVPEQSHTTQSIDSNIAVQTTPTTSMEVNVSVSNLEKEVVSTTATMSPTAAVSPTLTVSPTATVSTTAIVSPTATIPTTATVSPTAIVSSTDTDASTVLVECQHDPKKRPELTSKVSKSEGVSSGNINSEKSTTSLVRKNKHKATSEESDGGTQASSKRKRQPSGDLKITTLSATTLSCVGTPDDQSSVDDKSVPINEGVSGETSSKGAESPSQAVCKKSSESSKQEEVTTTASTQPRPLRSKKRFVKSQSPCSPQKRFKMEEHGSLSDMEQPHSSREGLMAIKPRQSPQKKTVKRSVRLKNVGGGPSGTKRKEPSSSSMMEGASLSKKMKPNSSSSNSSAGREKVDSGKMVGSEALPVVESAGDQVEGVTNDVSQEQSDAVNKVCSPDVPKVDEKSFEPSEKHVSKVEASLPGGQQHEPMETSIAIESTTPPPTKQVQETKVDGESQEASTTQQVNSTNLKSSNISSSSVDSATTTDIIEGADSLDKDRTETVKVMNKACAQSGNKTSETKEKKSASDDGKKEQDEKPKPPPMLRIRPGMNNIEILQAFNYNLKASLILGAPNVHQALILLRDIQDIQCSTSELEKVPDFVHTIRKLRRYSPSSKIMKRAEEVYIKLKALYMKPAQQSSLSLSQKRGPVGVTVFKKRPPTMMEWIQSQNNKLSHSNSAQSSSSHDPNSASSSSSSKAGITDIISRKPTPQQIMLANTPIVPDKPDQQDVQGDKVLPEQSVEGSVSLQNKTSSKVDQSTDQTEPLSTLLVQTGPSTTNTKTKTESLADTAPPLRRSTRGSSRKAATVNYSEMMESEVTATSESEDDQMVPG